MTSSLRRFLLSSAAGLLLPAALLSACGGNVVVDPPGGGGTGGGDTPTIPVDPDDCAPLTQCGDECVDTSNDFQHCGGCFQPCNDGVCVGGNCEIPPECPGDSTLCGGQCVDTGSDVFNCGECNNVCPPDASCVNGDCVEGSCLCGFICKFNDIGSGVPQSVSVAASALTDSVTPECGFSGFGDITFVFTAPFNGTYVFDTTGGVATTLQILSQTCAFYGCNDNAFPNGTSQLTVGLNGGETIYVIVDSQSASGTVKLNVSSATECSTCSEYITEPPDFDLCDQSAVLYNELVSCVCEQACAMQCQDLCSGFDISQECQDCVLDTVNGCGNQFNECANDV